MKRLVVDATNSKKVHQDIFAMALVNENNNDPVLVSVYEGGSEGGLPYVHVTFKTDKMCCVDLTKPCYSKHHDELPHMDANSKKRFIKVMTSYVDRAVKTANGLWISEGITGYHYAVHMWVKAHENGSYDKFNLDENGLPVMPDYKIYL